MPGVLLAVQLPQDVDRAVAGVHVEDSVHVGAPVDGVPAAQHTRGGGEKNQKRRTGEEVESGSTRSKSLIALRIFLYTVSIHYSIQYVYIAGHFIEHV